VLVLVLVLVCWNVRTDPVLARARVLYADVIYKDFGTNCMGTLAFVSGAGGRLDIYGDNFLDNAAPITNAIVSELNSYIIKEEKRDQF
jgi:hypothetical protein